MAAVLLANTRYLQEIGDTGKSNEWYKAQQRSENKKSQKIRFKKI